MPNPSGINPFTPQPAYGDVKKQTALQKSAPMSGAPVPAVTAPDRAKSRAVRPPKPRRAPASPKGTLPPYEVELPQTWLEIAATPGASDLVRKIAMRAARLNGGV